LFGSIPIAASNPFNTLQTITNLKEVLTGGDFYEECFDKLMFLKAARYVVRVCSLTKPTRTSSEQSNALFDVTRQTTVKGA
jgi:hypothetical protein